LIARLRPDDVSRNWKRCNAASSDQELSAIHKNLSPPLVGTFAKPLGRPKRAEPRTDVYLFIETQPMEFRDTHFVIAATSGPLPCLVQMQFGTFGELLAVTCPLKPSN
jgi:hypothetical protein